MGDIVKMVEKMRKMMAQHGRKMGKKVKLAMT